jgi:excinuclease ABC subunit A
VVATGTPEQVAKVTESYTGHYLKQLLDRRGGVATIASGKAASGNASRGRPTRSEAAE